MLLFENDVKVDGTQTCLTGIQISLLFENDVKVDSTETRLQTGILTHAV